MRPQDKVAIGWIDPGVVDGSFALAMAIIYRQCSDRVNGLLRVEGGGLLSRQRNELVARFMDTSDADWLLMIDADEQLSPEAFRRLCDAASYGQRRIVAGLYFAAWGGKDIYPMPVPLIFRQNENATNFNPVFDYPADTVIPIDAAGTGCLLVHRSVFQKFRDQADQHEGADWCWFRDQPVNGTWFSEDMYFCARARVLGFDLYAHTGVQLPHRKRYWLTEDHYRRSLETVAQSNDLEVAPT